MPPAKIVTELCHEMIEYEEIIEKMPNPLLLW